MKRIAGFLVLVSKDVPVEVSEVAAERHGVEDTLHMLHLIQQSQTCMAGAASSVLIVEFVIKREPEDRSCCCVTEL